MVKNDEFNHNSISRYCHDLIIPGNYFVSIVAEKDLLSSRIDFENKQKNPMDNEQVIREIFDSVLMGSNILSGKGIAIKSNRVHLTVGINEILFETAGDETSKEFLNPIKMAVAVFKKLTSLYFTGEGNALWKTGYYVHYVS